ncbi:MAG TPA: FAD-dependent oxidoreductase [Thermoanaerobaculia bacterium]|nr:FAD-dependent oxidoreductase [Thermoanaerobaculia bacterium]
MAGRAPTRLLLVGAGHAHLEILRRLILEPLRDVALTVVSVSPLHHYSGMVPGYLQGTYREDEIAVRIPDLVARAEGQFLCGRAVALRPDRQVVHVQTSPAETVEVPWDLVSFAVGSNTAGIDAPEIATEAQRIKPLERVAALQDRLRELARGGGTIPAVVVGGGAAGVEVALAMASALEKEGAAHRLTIAEGGKEILPGYRRRFRQRARDILHQRGIVALTGARITAVRPDSAATEDGTRIPSKLTVWLTGAVSWPLFLSSGLPLDDRGFLLTGDSLSSVDDPRIFAAGDCGTLASHPITPKAGVYAVREGPVLWQSLKAAVEGGQPPRYAPQSGFLSILNTGDGRALLDYKGIVSHSRWAWQLKDRIDRRFMRRHQELIDPEINPEKA